MSITLESAFEKILSHPSVASQKPIYEGYDKNVQGNTSHERGKTVCSITTCFKDFAELPEDKSDISVAIATGGNPYLAKVSAQDAAINAVATASLKLSCVGATPLSATDCLNFGNPEKPEQMQTLVDGIEGVKEVCEALNIPIVSGNVSLYNECAGKSIPPSATISIFGRVDNPHTVAPLGFSTGGETLMLIGKRSKNLGGSIFLEVFDQEDSQLPKINLKKFTKFTENIQSIANKQDISAINIVHQGGLFQALTQSMFAKNIGIDLEIPSDQDVPQFLFSEDLGVIVTTHNPEKIQEIFGEEAFILGKTSTEFSLNIKHTDKSIFTGKLENYKNLWENGLKHIF